ncbi:sodium/potassium-transporting ATPase subunit beta-2-like [Aplochiton taeniatus]
MAKDEDERKESGDTWRDFIWNSRTNEFMGRTASSWGLILLFYLIFYIFLAGMFVLTMYVMLLTLDDYKPTYQDRLTTPGMMIRPRGETLDLTYSIQDTESWDKYVQALDNFLAPYNNSQQLLINDVCTPDMHFIQEDSGEVRNNPKRSCQFNRTVLDACSGLTDRTYGYQAGQPCVLIKLNRVIGMLPGKDGQTPYVTCGAKKEDSDSIGEIAYYPPNGTFNLMYYPYYGKKAQVNYTQPLVAVKFLNLTMNADINVECKINSNNIATGTERDKFAGRVSFKLRISAKIYTHTHTHTHTHNL